MCRRSGILAEATNLVPPRRPKPRRRIQNISPTRPRISPTRPKYFADASKDFADASKIFRLRVQGFRRRVQRLHRRRGNAADATSYRCDTRRNLNATYCAVNRLPAQQVSRRSKVAEQRSSCVFINNDYD